jgi:hypothetical protein
MSSIISQFVCGSRNFFSQGFHSLPVVLITTILVLGITQGNLNLLFLFVGLGIVTPLVCLLSNILFEFIFGRLSVPTYLWQMEAGNAEQCLLFTKTTSSLAETMNVVPSYWITIMSFFFTYLFTNAYALYNKQSSSKASTAAVDARKSQTMISMIILSITAIMFTIVRFSTGCETGLGVLLSFIIGSLLASGWYMFMRQCGLGRLDDVFGISNRLLPLQSYEGPDTTVCVPTK